MREGSFIKASCRLVYTTVGFRMLALVPAALVVLATSVTGNQLKKSAECHGSCTADRIDFNLVSFTGQAGFKCPTKNGFYPDKEQCDLYYECRRGVPTQKLCDDGMAFIWAHNPLYAKCDVITNVDCSDRPYLREFAIRYGRFSWSHILVSIIRLIGRMILAEQAKTSLHCPRANGYYRHEKWPQICDEFYQCDKGKVKVLKCQPGLAFDPVTSGCQWAAKVEGCEYLTDVSSRHATAQKKRRGGGVLDIVQFQHHYD